MASRVTSTDVARRAGVSQSTVSLVLSGKGEGRISAATIAAVRDAAATLGYRPNAVARALRTGLPGTVGLVVPDVTHPFFGHVLRGAQVAARRTGHAIALVDADDRGDASLTIAALRGASADGLLLFGVEVELGPLEVAVGIEVPPGPVPTVRLDVGPPAAALARHLLDLGHRRIGHLASATPGSTFALREEALRRALLEGGAGEPRVARAVFEVEAAAGAAAELLGAGCTAIFCDDDVLAAGAYLAAREAGLAIPRDVSITGFDDLPFARVLEPALTTAVIDADELGRTAFEVLADRLAGRTVAAERRLPVDLAIRASTAPPRT